ncbi:MAG TPA: 16S rRNA (cytosine(1402)-N(4))-methyltransferase RsmH [Chloroflexota bacterium]|nr:16S rRNA (cytosine(1402)-N(4))-methyltransferase RsmH [Chloroflexota bacterium]
MEERAHTSVLLQEAIEALAVKPGGRYVDCTLGRGGHTAAMLERGGSVLALDADPQAIAEVSLPATIVQSNFDQLERVATARGFVPADGVLFDLGLSSPQLEDASRGFSFAKEGPLDMRFDPGSGDPAAEIVNRGSVDELARIFRDYGEEPQPRRMARAIESARPLRTTRELAEVIERAAGGRGRIHPATRIFQALRIATNRELERLSDALAQAVRILRSGGRLVVISFHSLEDRIVKAFIAREARDCLCPSSAPVCVCGHKASLRSVTRKPIVPSGEEIARNPRARSAKLRAAERI